MGADRTTQVTSSRSGFRGRACGACEKHKIRCDRQSPCSNCRRKNLQCSLGPDHPAAGISYNHPTISTSCTPQLSVGEKFKSVIQTLLEKGEEEVLRLALAASQRRDDSDGDEKFQQAITKASQLLDKSEARTPGYLAATIILAVNSMEQNRVEFVKTLLRSIKAIGESLNDTDLQGSIGRQLLPITKLFVIYCAMAWQGDVQETLPIWNRDTEATPEARELRRFASLPKQIRLATPEELLSLAQLMNAKIRHLHSRYRRTPYNARPLLAESFAVYYLFYLEILERSEAQHRFETAESVIKITTFLRKSGPYSHCVASYPQWRARALIKCLGGEKLGMV